jgi:flavin reductase ActVB
VTAQQLAPELVIAFTEAMSRLVSGVAVVTARRPDGQPCGLLVSSICSYSVRPPSVLLAVDEASRSFRTLTCCAEFGVHLLGSAQGDVAAVFASRSDAKFSGLGWRWDGAVPRLDRMPVYLRCTRPAVFQHGDHAMVVGEVADAQLAAGEPLIYYRRRLTWTLGHREG